MASTTLSSFTLGHCVLSLRFKDRFYPSVKLSVLDNLCTDVLLGHDFLRQHRSIEIPFEGTEPPLSLCNLVAIKVPPVSLFTHLLNYDKPIATKSRRHSASDALFIQSEVTKLLESGIIELSQSPWRAQVLVTSNERQKRRMVVDYSQTVNKFTCLDAYPFPRIDDLISNISHFTVFSTLDLQSAYHQIPIRPEDKVFTAFEACGRLYQFTRIPFGVTNGVAAFQRTIDSIIENEKLAGTFAYLDNVTVCGTTLEDHDRNMTNFLDIIKKYGIILNDDKSTVRSTSIRLLGYEISQNVIKPDPERLQPLRNLPAPTNLKAQERVVGMFAYYSQWIPHFSDKINVMVRNRVFPLPAEVLDTFKKLKDEIQGAMVTSIDPEQSLIVETDASDIALAASLNQNGRPVAFFSRTLSPSERKHSSIEKEAYAIVECLRKWRHLLIGRHFTLVTDQRSVSFMFDQTHASKVKNEKIQRWRLELSNFHYDVVYRPGADNRVADTLSRNFNCSLSHTIDLKQLHDSLCHPGSTRFFHLIRARNLPFSSDDVKKLTSQCAVCSEIKPRFHTPLPSFLVKATQPFERISLDFKGPIPSVSRNKYFLTIIDEYSRFPFAYPCSDISASTVITCLTNLFSIFGLPSFIHSDRGSAFMSKELRSFLTEKGIATSHTTPYNPQSNGQVERLNGTLWKTILLALNSRQLKVEQWETVLPDALHSIRTLLCTATNATPHERMFRHDRRAATGLSLPSWLINSDTVLLRKQNRTSKYDPLVEEVELIQCNPTYARIRHPDGHIDTVSLRHLAPCAEKSPKSESEPIDQVQTGYDALPSSHETTTELPRSTMNTEESHSSILHLQQRVRPYNLRNREA